MRWMTGCVLISCGALLAGCTQSESTTTTAISLGPAPLKCESAGYVFGEPIQLTADGEPVSVEAPGYACPTVADVDGDGAADLVVGQFNSGKMKFFRNIAAPGASPELAGGEWLTSGEEPLTVPGVW